MKFCIVIRLVYMHYNLTGLVKIIRWLATKMCHVKIMCLSSRKFMHSVKFYFDYGIQTD